MACTDPRIVPVHTADFIVVGAGAAGAAVAHLLSTGSNPYSVIALEAGENDVANPLLSDPLNSGVLVPNYINEFFMNYGHSNESTAGLFWPYVAGRTVGGGSSVNGMQQVRSTSQYWDSIYTLTGDASWAGANINSIAKAMETFNGPSGDPGVHGTTGPVDVRQATLNPGASAAFSASCTNVTGDAFAGDYNNPATPLGPFDLWQLFQTPASERSSSATAFIDIANMVKAYELPIDDEDKEKEVYISANNRLKLYVRATVTKAVICETDTPSPGTKVASGVIASVDGRELNFIATRGVILCGGLASPLILERSGIGDSTRLTNLGINVEVDNPNVGEHVENHTIYTITGVPGANPIPGTNTDDAALYAGGAFLTDPTRAEPTRRHIQLLNLSLPPTAFLVISQYLSPISQGYIHLNAFDPQKMPDMRFNYLEDPQEIIRNAKMIEIARDIILDMGLTVVEDIDTQAKLEAFVVNNKGQSYHWTSACRMGTSDADSVVDSNLKVWGVEHLWVCDDMVLPHTTDGNTASPAMYVAHVFADKIKGNPPALFNDCPPVVTPPPPSAAFAPPPATPTPLPPFNPLVSPYGCPSCPKKQ